jgi:hypothetical protein
LAAICVVITVSLLWDVVWFRLNKDDRLTSKPTAPFIVMHHTLVTRVAFSVALAYFVTLLVGVLCRARFAWRLGFACSLALFIVFGSVAFSTLPQMSDCGLVPQILAVFSLMGAVGWTRDWRSTEDYFR